MNKELKELIEKLKEPELAQARALLTDQERAIFDKAGLHNMLWLNDSGAWTSPGTGKVRGNTYILKRGYEPEPEYEEWEIRTNNEGNLAAFNKVGGAERTLGRCAHQPNFVCFHYIDGPETTIPGNVPNWRRRNPGQVIYARFVKD